jgi:hypothetical protein
MPKIVNDFHNDVPSELIVHDGIDAFTVQGRCMLFIEMIADVASDLAAPGSQYHDETLAWVQDPANLEAWLQIVNVSPEVIPVLQNAFLERAVEVKHACEILSRTVSRNGGDLSRFMEAMGMESASSDSSLMDWNRFDEESSAECYSSM